MSFENLEDANAFEIQANQRIKDLQEQLANQKLAYEEKYNSDTTNLQSQVNSQTEEITKYKAEIDRLKIANYNYFEQISIQNNQTGNSSSLPKEQEPTINDILKSF